MADIADRNRVLVLAWDSIARQHVFGRSSFGSLEANAKAARAIVELQEGSIRLLNDCAAWLAMYDDARGEEGSGCGK